MSAPTKQTLAFFGATGGVAGSSLAAALRSGHHCTALARTPSKLRDQLKNKFAIPEDMVDSYLTIHQGNAKDVTAVSKALISPLNSKALVDTIYSGIGNSPKFNTGHGLWEFIKCPVTGDDATVCATGMATVLSAIELLRSQGVTASSSAQKPLVIAISTIGTREGMRDVPFLYRPLYTWVLAIARKDKENMEQVLIDDNASHIRDFVIIRPTVLTDGVSGLDKVRAGWEWGIQEESEKREQEAGPQLGYYVGRTDVGEWVMKNVVQEGGWEGRCISLTY